jgi:hypothetical protein
MPLKEWVGGQGIGESVKANALTRCCLTNNNAWQHSPLTIQSTLNLKKDDQVWLQIFHQSTGSFLVDRSDHFTYFTGFMLEEIRELKRFDLLFHTGAGENIQIEIS